LKKHTFLKVVPYKPLAITYGFFSGCISTLIGIGGATLNVPFMVFCKIPVHQAVGTAAALSTIISLPAMIGFIAIGLDKQGLPPFTFGYVNYLAFLTIIPTSTLLVPFGASISHKVTVKNLRRIFGIFMILVALKMWENIWDFL
ncbi:MAG: sulfite exporter TauE/SafE family protein, partial [Alphaproteobacteria bacterium]|nr:sulfite exporter TauE/SafE family protein [Alphaproteobacteria bacterium]